MFAPLKKISLKRPIASYAKVQYAVSWLIRSNDFFIARRRINKLKLLNVGCGPNSDHREFINMDYHWDKNIDICWNIIKKPYPIPDNYLEGIYTEHCLEHISLAAFEANIKEFYRVLKPGGTARIIMPDGEYYFDIYQQKKEGKTVHMPFEEHYISPMARINGLFRNHGHQFIYDFYTVKTILERVGFKNVVKDTYGHGRDPRLLIDTEWRNNESFYIEATK